MVAARMDDPCPLESTSAVSMPEAGRKLVASPF
jgi:hypothetical protein